MLKTTFDSGALRLAQTLMYLHIAPGALDTVLWQLHSRWKVRLIWCGIDPETLLISDQNRFNLAWENLRNGFDINVQIRDVLSGKVCNNTEPIEVEIGDDE